MSSDFHIQVNSAGVTRLVRVAVIVLALAAFALHAWQALAGAYLSYVSGIWLALGRDLERRPLLSRPLE